MPTPPPSTTPKPGAPVPGAPVPPPMPARSTVPQPSIAEKPTPTPAKPAKQPIFATLTSNPKRFLPFALGALVLVGVVGFLMYYFLGRGGSQSVTDHTTPGSNRQTVPATQTTLTYWGLWEPNDVLDQTLRDFEQQNPGVKVQYVKQSHLDYRERLQTAIASQNGPDVFRFHASWVPMLKAELATMPSSVMSSSEYQQTFYPIAFQQLQNNGQIVGIPLMYDGLALYYNKAHLQAANAQPPETWAELKTLASQLTIRSTDGMTRGGLAIGNAANVEHFTDIIGLLMLQNGADPSQPTGKAATEALTFYTNFYTKDKVWDENLPSSTVAFARGEASMMFAPSWRALEVKALNPELDFGIAPVPKLGTEKIAWGSYWAEGVNSKSRNRDAGWKLLDYLSSKEVQQKLYASQSEVRAFGEPYSRVDLSSTLA
ncbi:MAG TPA: extracellular solute-binding protein, partial [Patescibacteria group bacterium]